MRIENDLLGSAEIDDKLYGIHTFRALNNFPPSGEFVLPEFISAMLEVKVACAKANFRLHLLPENKASMIVNSAEELLKQLHLDADTVIREHFPVNPYQGGAGTSCNMNVNEVITNFALIQSGKNPGDYSMLSPIDDVNKSQSTNDVFPTALRIAAIRGLRKLQKAYEALQAELQKKERLWSSVIKLGRTQLQDAVPVSLGNEFGAYAQAIARDRWRLYNAEERLRSINLGGTAIGTSIAGHPGFPASAADELRKITALPLAKAEDLIDNTQNLDVFVEVHGIVKAGAVTLTKIAQDLRLLSSGPIGGIGELHLPQLQAGSSIMPGKVNPVMPEYVIQISEMIKGHDGMITNLCASGNLELNQFSPMIAHLLLKSLQQLSVAVPAFTSNCISGITPVQENIRKHLLNSSALATAFIKRFGYDKMSEIVKDFQPEIEGFDSFVQSSLGISKAEFYLIIREETGITFE